MFPLQRRKLTRGAAGHVAAGLGIGADYEANYVDLFLPFDGRIERFYGAEGGNWLRLIRPNGDKLEFAHLSKYLVPNGTYKEGTRVAVTGNSGTITTGPHLHVQIFNTKGQRIDPEQYNWQAAVTFKVKVIANRQNWNYRPHFDEAAAWYAQHSQGRINLAFDFVATDFTDVVWSDSQVDNGWYESRILALALGSDVAILMLDHWNGTTGSAGRMSGDSRQRTLKIQIFTPEAWGEYVGWQIKHELSHAVFYLTVGEPNDPTHQKFSADNALNRAHGHEIFPLIDYATLISAVETRRKERPMNQSRIVLSKDGKTVYKATPIATDFENFKKQMEIEGIQIPDPIPAASQL